MVQRSVGCQNTIASFDLGDLTDKDGELVLRVFRTSDDGLIRAFRLPIAAGKLQQHPRAVLGYEPQMDFILPRVPEPGGSSYELIEAFWFESRAD